MYLMLSKLFKEKREIFFNCIFEKQTFLHMKVTWMEEVNKSYERRRRGREKIFVKAKQKECVVN